MTRRNFLKATASAAAAAPLILPSHMRAADTHANGRIGVGYIGAGRLSRRLLFEFLHEDAQVLAVCDVDTTRRKAARKTVDDFYRKNPDKGSPACKDYGDFRELLAREDIDAVCIATPDHWHAVITLAALRSGKDIYCEKPLTHDIAEAVAVMKAVGNAKRVLQTGSMQRSMKEFRVACELVRNGAIGTLLRVECNFGDPPIACDLPEEPAEPGLDWDLWLGPAAQRPYNSVLSPRGVHKHFPKWRNYREFGGGQVADWGAHQLDVAQWAMGMDHSGPVEVVPPGVKDPKRLTFTYANGIPMYHGGAADCVFHGTDGTILVSRGGIHSEPRGILATPLDASAVHLNRHRGHRDDFLHCVRTREKTIATAEIGHRTSTCCQLGNICHVLQRPLKWDPETERFVGDDEANRLLGRAMRSPWRL